MRHVTLTRSLLVLSFLLATVGLGCLPIELSVSPDGEVLIPRQEGFVVYQPADGGVTLLHAPDSGQPAFAMYSPDGQQALALVQAEGGGMGQNFQAVLLGANGKAKDLLSRSNITYMQWSPDGKYATITRVADQKKGNLDQNLPELILIDIQAGTSKTIASNIAGIHRWMPDGKSVVIFQIERKSEESSQYAGKLMTLNVETGEAAALASMMGEQGAFFDISPDGKAAMVTALKVAPNDADLPDKVDGKASLYALNLISGEHNQVTEDAGFAIYSPDGSKVLVGGSDEKDGAITLSTMLADGSGLKALAEDAAKSAGSGMGPGQATIYPTWLDNDTVLYLAKHAVYGTAGTNLQLTSIKTDGSEKTNHQGEIEYGLLKK
jgi:dipeptidyl aminopeptidase/acylaminoacyl peptidase